jgi:Fe-S-cluster containining protein
LPVARGADILRPLMVSLAVVESRIELLDYSPSTTLVELAEQLNAFRSQPGLMTSFCAMCSRCCYDTIPLFGYDVASLQRLAAERGERFEDYVVLPERVSTAARRRGIRELERDNGMSRAEATLIYEANAASPISLARNGLGGCRFLDGPLCSIYPRRPFACRLYLCNMGERLESLYDGIVTQGIWHSYHVMGWIEAEEIIHNPFLSAESFDEVMLEGFEADLGGVAEDLFFYF